MGSQEPMEPMPTEPLAYNQDLRHAVILSVYLAAYLPILIVCHKHKSWKRKKGPVCIVGQYTVVETKEIQQCNRGVLVSTITFQTEGLGFEASAGLSISHYLQQKLCIIQLHCKDLHPNYSYTTAKKMYFAFKYIF